SAVGPPATTTHARLRLDRPRRRRREAAGGRLVRLDRPATVHRRRGPRRPSTGCAATVAQRRPETLAVRGPAARQWATARRPHLAPRPHVPTSRLLRLDPASCRPS